MKVMSLAKKESKTEKIVFLDLHSKEWKMKLKILDKSKRRELKS